LGHNEEQIDENERLAIGGGGDCRHLGLGASASADVTLNVDGTDITFFTTDPGDANHALPMGFTDIDDAPTTGLTFLAEFDPSNSGGKAVDAVEAFVANQGAMGVVYLGRDPAGPGPDPVPSGTSVITHSTDGGFSGTWTFSPGATGDVVSFLSIHAGSGTEEFLYAVDTPGTSGIWDTSESFTVNSHHPDQQDGHNVSFIDFYGGDTSGACLLNCGVITGSIPEPGTLAMFGTAFIGGRSCAGAARSDHPCSHAAMMGRSLAGRLSFWPSRGACDSGRTLNDRCTNVRKDT
jgi:hypothetical protein